MRLLASLTKDDLKGADIERIIAYNMLLVDNLEGYIENHNYLLNVLALSGFNVIGTCDFGSVVYLEDDDPINCMFVPITAKDNNDIFYMDINIEKGNPLRYRYTEVPGGYIVCVDYLRNNNWQVIFVEDLNSLISNRRK